MLILDAIGLVILGLVLGGTIMYLMINRLLVAEKKAYNTGYEDGSNNRQRKEIYR